MGESFRTYVGILGFLIDHGDTYQRICAVEQMEGIMRENRRRICPGDYDYTMNLLQLVRMVIDNTNEDGWDDDE